jgi:foldase protein PrsA
VIVRVGEEQITREEFERWRGVMERWAEHGVRASGGGNASDEMSDEASRTATDETRGDCVADEHEAEEARADGNPLPWCGRDSADLHTDALRVLISLKWLEGEARALGLTISDAEVKAALVEHTLETFPEERDYRAFLRETKTTEADMLVSARLAVLTKRVDEAALERGLRISEEEVERFYQSRRGRFRRPEERDLRLIVTRTEDRAREALQTLRSGTPWDEAAAKYSRDPSAVDGGKVEARPRGMMVPEVDEAVFSARPGVLTGPVRGADGFYIFEVTKVRPAGEQSPEAARETIRQLLRSQQQTTVLKRFKSEFTERWRARTTCEPGFVIAECGNAN